MKIRLISALAIVCLVVLGTSSAALAATTQLSASLSGANEVGDGDPDGTGSAVVDIDPETGEVCFAITVSGVDAPSAAHIHVGGAGTNGGVVVDFDWANTNGEGCVTAPSPTLVAITTNPSLYYVNVHNADFPGGAVRGQLAASAGEPVEVPSELAFTGSGLTSLLAAAGVALVATGGGVLRAASRRDRD